MVGPFRFIGYAVTVAILYFAFGTDVRRVADRWRNMGGITTTLDRLTR